MLLLEIYYLFGVVLLDGVLFSTPPLEYPDVYDFVSIDKFLEWVDYSLLFYKDL